MYPSLLQGLLQLVHFQIHCNIGTHVLVDVRYIKIQGVLAQINTLRILFSNVLNNRSIVYEYMIVYDVQYMIAYGI